MSNRKKKIADVRRRRRGFNEKACRKMFMHAFYITEPSKYTVHCTICMQDKISPLNYLKINNTKQLIYILYIVKNKGFYITQKHVYVPINSIKFFEVEHNIT